MNLSIVILLSNLLFLQAFAGTSYEERAKMNCELTVYGDRSKLELTSLESAGEQVTFDKDSMSLRYFWSRSDEALYGIPSVGSRPDQELKTSTIDGSLTISIIIREVSDTVDDMDFRMQHSNGWKFRSTTRVDKEKTPPSIYFEVPFHDFESNISKYALRLLCD